MNRVLGSQRAGWQRRAELTRGSVASLSGQRGVLKHMSPVLVLDHDDEERELEFELAFLRSLTTQQRFDLMFQRSREMAEILLRHGYRKPSEVVERS